VYAALDIRFPPLAPHLPDLLSAALDDLGPSAVHEVGSDDEPFWRVFFPSAEARDDAAGALAVLTAADGLSLVAVDVPDEDWAARSQRDLRAVRVGRILVAPPWDRPESSTEEDASMTIVIQPSTGFGTGHHETTRLCLELLQETGCGGMRVIDVGTGSGILALAAAALGAREVDAIDIDPDAIRSARENVSLNAGLAAGDTAARVRVAIGDGREPREPADLVLANLTGGLLMAAAERLVSLARPGGRLLLSGFQTHEADAVVGAFGGACRVIGRRQEGPWGAVLLTIDD
jgi:ribosomal protein L11 methyltransferase